MILMILCINIGDMIKLRATDARARQEWVDKLRAVTEMYTRAIASSHPPLPPREHSANSNRNPVAKLEVLDAFANCQEQLRKVEKHNLALAQTIENSSLNLDPDLLVLKATAHTTLYILNQCLNILYQ